MLINKLGKLTPHTQLSFLLALVVVLFSYMRWKLYFPQRFPLCDAEIGLLIIFILGNIFLLITKSSDNRKARSGIFVLIIPLLLFISAFYLGIQISHPSYKLKSDSEAFLDKQNTAVKKGVELGEKVLDEEIDKVTAFSEIDSDGEIADENKDIAKDAVKSVADEYKNVAEIQAEAAPTIPLSYMKWNCNKYGCAFLGDEYVWQLSTENQIAGSLIVFLSMCMMTLSIRRFNS